MGNNPGSKIKEIVWGGMMDIERIEEEINSLNYKDRLDADDQARLAKLRAMLQKVFMSKMALTEKAEVYNMFINGIYHMDKPQGFKMTKGNLILWREIRDGVIAYVRELRDEKEGA